MNEISSFRVYTGSDMKEGCEQEIEFFDAEVDLCHGFLDTAGPKPSQDVIAKVRLGYERLLHCLWTVHDPAKLDRLTAKLDRLRERLSAFSYRIPSSARV